MCKKWCLKYRQCPHLGKLETTENCDDISAAILESAGVGKGDAKVERFREACEKNTRIDMIETYEACLQDILNDQ